METDGEFQRLP